MTRSPAYGRRAGFTLIESMIVVTVAAILLGLAVPSFQRFLDNQRLATVVNELHAAIRLTRSEAIKRGVRVDLVAQGNPANWGEGWIVLVDANTNGVADVGEEIIFRRGPVNGGFTLASAMTDNSRPYIAYDGTGRTRTNASAQGVQLGNITVSREGTALRRIVINFLGRPRVCNPQGGDC